MFLLANNCFTDNALLAGALSWCKIHPFLHNSGRFLLTRSRYFVKTADLPSGRWVPTLPTQYPGYQRKHSTCPWTSKDSCFFFGLGDDVEFHCIDCRMVSGSYVNTQVSSQAIIEFSKPGSFSLRCKRSKYNSLRLFFVHLTAFLEPFLHKPFSCSILPLQSVEHFPCPNWLPQLLLQHPTFGLLNHISHFFNVVIGKTVRGRPGRSSSFTLSLPSENCLCNSNTRARDMQSSPQASVNNWNVSVWDFFSLTRNLLLTRCSLCSPTFSDRG